MAKLRVGRGVANSLQKFTADYDEPSYSASPDPQKAVAALLSHQLVCHRLHHYFLSIRISQWLQQLSQYDLKARTPKAVKSQAIADLLAQVPGEEEFLLDNKIPGEVAMANAVREQWVMKFDGSSTPHSGGVGIVLYHKEDEVMAISFKFEFSYSNNTAKYKAYLTGLATTLEMGIKHLKVIGNLNLVVCQTKGSFSLKEPRLALYRTITQKMEEKFSTFEIKHALRSENQMSGGILLRCVGQEEVQRKLREVHDRTCGFYGEVSLYRRLQKADFYWPSMGKDADQVQTQCEAYQLAIEREESYVVFIGEDWRNLFVQYLVEGILPQKHSERYKLKRLATNYFLHGGVLFKKVYDGDPLRCLGLEEVREIIKEVYAGECGEHQGKKKLYICLL
ncbi:uncharacterized protein LOC142606438 [Castanea sativa]|uniref:uncharacterized protein LOC142606438 n=1 Tax=Castanea sativa TaxID=21020 RepID=UPI003F651F09